MTSASLEHDHPYCPGAESRWVTMLALFLLSASIFFFLWMVKVYLSVDTARLHDMPHHESGPQTQSAANTLVVAQAACIVGWLLAAIGAYVKRHPGVVILSLAAPMLNLAGIYGAWTVIETIQSYATRGD